MKIVTCISPVNIAVIKYWGKRDEDLILPLNSSISVTLDSCQLRAKTSVAIGKELKQDRIWINGEEAALNKRVKTVLKEARRRALKRPHEGTGEYKGVNPHHYIHICSENNFPTGAGLASSAAGYACLAYSLAQLFNIEGQISDIARLGSGSACRSLYGGFVTWHCGVLPDGTDSVATQLSPETHWSNLRILILVVNEDKKRVPSTEGMRTSVQTSSLLTHRLQTVLPTRLTQLSEAIQQQDFQTFSEITMQDSNQLHAICLDTYPPISYLNDTSHQIISLVHAINSYYGKNKVAYTFDAGPNACLFLELQDLTVTLQLLTQLYSNPGDENFIRGHDDREDDISENKEFTKKFSSYEDRGAVKYVIVTRPGAGPKLLSDLEESLLDSDALPCSRP